MMTMMVMVMVIMVIMITKIMVKESRLAPIRTVGS